MHEDNCNIPSLMKLNFSTNLHYYQSALLIKLSLHTQDGKIQILLRKRLSLHTVSK